MSRWMAQRPVALQGVPGSQREQGAQVSGPDQRQSSRRGSAKQTGGVGMLLHHAEDFGLTDDQVDALQKMMVEFEIEKIDLEAALRKAKVRWRALIRDLDAAEGDVLKAIEEVCSCEGNLRRMRYSHLKKTRSLLDEDQCSSLKSFHLKQSRAKAQGQGQGR